jgi:ribosome-associated toxin RatA of RatAB toxin-antitoxin module
LKAYTAHNLRIYLYQAAGMFELIDDVENAAKFFHLFLNFKESSADLRVAKENAKLIFYGAGMYISIPHFGLLP